MTGQFQVYKGSGALQASFIAYDPEKKRSGAVLLEVAGSLDKNARTYNWDKKISFALGLNDIAQILDFYENGRVPQLRLVHVPGGDQDRKDEAKTMVLKSGEGKYEGTFMFSFEDRGRGNQASVGFTGGEMIIFVEIIKSSLRDLVGFYSWKKKGSRSEDTSD